MHILPSPFSVRTVANSEIQRFLKLLERPAGRWTAVARKTCGHRKLCFEKGRQLNDDDRLIWSHFISKFGWSDFATARLEELKQKHGVSDRKDIMTIADAIDLDEKRKS
jgi:hypothetical protein